MKPALAKKLAIAGIILLLLFLVKFFGLDQYLTLSFLKAQQARFAALYAANPLTVLGAYALTYIVVTALSLPGAAVMSLAGGGLFGLVTGTIVVSVASTIGATCACLVARYLLRDWVQSRFGDKLAKINEG